jgi:hypothetical protein
MKLILKLSLVGLVCLTARADILRLRDGRLFTGNFLGATRTEIWFQPDTPGEIIGAAAYPVAQVESVTFGPVPSQSPASRENVTLPANPRDRDSNSSSRPSELISPRP